METNHRAQRSKTTRTPFLRGWLAAALAVAMVALAMSPSATATHLDEPDPDNPDLCLLGTGDPSNYHCIGAIWYCDGSSPLGIPGGPGMPCTVCTDYEYNYNPDAETEAGVHDDNYVNCVGSPRVYDRPHEDVQPPGDHS